MTMQGPSKSVSEIIGKIADALDNHLGSPAWRGNASVELRGSKITFTDNAGSQTELDLSGLVAPALPEALTALSYDPATQKLIYTAEDARTTEIDLSGLGSDVHISGGSYDPETMRLTLKDASEHTPDVIIDFSGLVVHLSTNEDGTYSLKDGRGLIGVIDTRRTIEPFENPTGELWVDGRPVIRAIFDVSGTPDGVTLAEGVQTIVRQYGGCSDGMNELPAPQDHDGNTFQAVRSLASGIVTFRRAGNFAVAKPGEWLIIEFVRMQ
jgi:hypothetical protein